MSARSWYPVRKTSRCSKHPTANRGRAETSAVLKSRCRGPYVITRRFFSISGMLFFRPKEVSKWVFMCRYSLARLPCFSAPPMCISVEKRKTRREGTSGVSESQKVARLHRLCICLSDKRSPSILLCLFRRLCRRRPRRNPQVFPIGRPSTPASLPARRGRIRATASIACVQRRRGLPVNGN